MPFDFELLLPALVSNVDRLFNSESKESSAPVALSGLSRPVKAELSSIEVLKEALSSKDFVSPPNKEDIPLVGNVSGLPITNPLRIMFVRS